jgi:gliding motility-associated-like protein
MKAGKILFTILLVCLLTENDLHSQAASGKNLSFDLGNFTNWAGYTWRKSILVPSINTSPVKGIVSRRQTIMSDTGAYDANTGYALRKIPKGYKFSAKLGDEIISSDGMPRCWEQSLRYTLAVDSTNCLLIFKFALVLQYATDHNATNEPRFKLTLYDNAGSVLPDCSNYDVYASNKNVKGFSTYMPPNSTTPVEWRDWTTVGANLTKYIGQTITVEFMTADCLQRYHYGYAYFIAEAHPMYITVKFCENDTAAVLTAPEGFEKYKWTTGSGIKIDTLRAISLKVPDFANVYTCTMTSATGCIVSLQSKVARYEPKAAFSSFMLDCNSNTVQFTNSSTKTFGTLGYEWQFGDGNSSFAKSPPYTFSFSGMHTVTLILTNPPSSCTDSLTKEVESFSPPLVGINGDSTYCYGMSTKLTAYGAYEYVWSTGSTSQSIDVSDPGGLYWMLGRSSTGCVSDTLYKDVGEDPFWPFFAEGDTMICGNSEVTLSASGAQSYVWNKRITVSSSGTPVYIWTKATDVDSIVTSSPGLYIVTGLNARGCKKSVTFNVSAYSMPDVDISFSPEVLDRKHTTLSVSAPGESGVSYTWSLGDGSGSAGPTISHTYTIADTTLKFLVRLKALSAHGCKDSTAKYIDVVPFIPNVFSPNNDGMNDVFMNGFEIEIVDRNGLQIYKGKDGWDGKRNGDPVDPDTYFYLVYYRDSAEKLHIRKGYVTLIR